MPFTNRLGRGKPFCCKGSGFRSLLSGYRCVLPGIVARAPQIIRHASAASGTAAGLQGAKPLAKKLASPPPSPPGKGVGGWGRKDSTGGRRTPTQPGQAPPHSGIPKIASFPSKRSRFPPVWSRNRKPAYAILSPTAGVLFYKTRELAYANCIRR